MKKLFKWIGILLGSLLALLLVVAVILYFIGSSKFNATFEIPENRLLTSFTSDSASVAKGERLVQTRFCGACHGENLGGNVMADAPPFFMVAPNLTPGAGGISDLSDKDLDRIIRNGAKKDNVAYLPVMPFIQYQHFTDEDINAIISYLRTLPPIDNELPPSEIRWLGKIVFAMEDFSRFKPNHSATTVASINEEPSSRYGEYLYNTACLECHRQDLEGGPNPNPEAKPVPPLEIVKLWNVNQFASTLRTGKTPEQKELDEESMPFPYFKYLNDIEIEALHKYITGH